MTEILRGGCACGQVRYEVDTAPAFSLLCMCRQCQRISGSGHSAQFAAMAAGTRMQGVLRYHDYVADSGNTVSCGFCPNCGNPVLKKPAGYPKLVFFHAATLDEPQNFRPQKVVFSKAGQCWDHVDPALPLV